MSEYEVCSVTKRGVSLKKGRESVFVDFETCAAHSPVKDVANCVAMRNESALEFAFFTAPPTIICLKKRGLKSLLDKNALRRFQELQATIERQGYSTVLLA